MRSIRYLKGIFVCIAVLVGVVSVSNARDIRETFIVANSADIKTLDPLYTGDAISANVFLQIYDHLIFQDLEGNLSPRLAEKWEQPDPLTYILYLRKGVKFHNGEDFTAEDAKFTIDRGRKNVTATGANVLLKDIKDVEIKDDYTIVIHMSQPYTPLLYAFSEVWGSVVDKGTVERLGESYAQNPVGTGPFKFVSWQKGDRVTLERNDNYWGEKAPFKNLVIRAVPETSVRSIELESGAVDMVFKLAVNDIQHVKANSELEVLRRTDLRTDFFFFNCSKPPFDDSRVRRAIALALDTVAIEETVYLGLGYAPEGPLPHGMMYQDTKLPQHVRDVEEAKKLLEEAQIKNLTVDILVNEAKERVDAATIAQAYLAEIGVTVNIKVVEFGIMLDLLNNGEFEISMLGWGNNLPDPEYSLSRLYHSRGIGATNWARFSNKEFDELLDAGTVTPDGPDRGEIYKKAQELFIREVPALYWYGGETIIGINKQISYFPLHRRGIYEFNKVQLSQ